MVHRTTEKSDLEGLTLLGEARHESSKKLETFPNKHPQRDYLITLETDEFTCLCPATGQPDFAKITIHYTPDKKIIESKSLKLYLWSYRQEGVFHEHLANAILDDLVAVLAPRQCEIVAQFSHRGGIAITVKASYPQS